MNKKELSMKQIGILATPEEVQNIELIMKKNTRKTYSDAIRFLINQEAQKILNQNTAISVK